MKKKLLLNGLIVMAMFVLSIFGCSEDGEKPVGPGGGDNDEDTVVTIHKSVHFSNTEPVWNTEHEIIWIESDLSIKGYADKDRLTVGGYWFRKGKDGKYYYVTTNCDKNVPDNILGHQFLTPIPDDNVFINNQQYGAVHFSCFPDRTGQYYGKIKLYNSKSVGIDPNSATLAQSIWVSICWGDCSSGSPGKATPIIRILSEDKIYDLKNLINWQMH